MSPSKKSAKKQRSLPPWVDFKTWRDRFERTLLARTPEGEAFQCWTTKAAARYKSFGETEMAERGSLLHDIYGMTRPHWASNVERKKHESAAKKLCELLPVVNSTVTALKACGSEMFAMDSTPPRVHMSDLIRHLEESAFHIEGTLLTLDRRNMRSADALDHCMLFLSELDDFGVAEADALGLARLAMKAHGFTEAELEKFSRDSQKLGTPRKRKKQYFSNLYDVVESYLALYRKHKNLPEAKSYLAQYRKHKNIPEFNPAHYRQKINYLRKNPSSIIPD